MTTIDAPAAQIPAATSAVTQFAGRAGDHNERAMAASGPLADILGERLATTVTAIGQPAPALCTSWDTELEAARSDLAAMAGRYETLLSQGKVPITALSRCAVALATLPKVAAHRPDAVVIWFDAHADLNTPEESTTGYLGGLALAGPLGRWDSGLGGGLAAQNAILVGARDIDGTEQQLIDDGIVSLVPVGPTMAEDLAALIDGRPAYVHIDCDVLDAGTVPTDYRVPDGMTIDQLRGCARAIARSEIVGIEIGELESDGHTDPRLSARMLIDALDPIFSVVLGHA
ncbi:MAG: arginase family protein [Janthinobacterium lividum]